MDLKSGRLFWPERTPAVAAYETAAGDIDCEVAVLGAGLTGTLVSYALQMSGFDVVMVDKRRVAAGSTAASTALVLYHIDVPLTRLISLRGKSAAQDSYRLCYEAISRLEEWVLETRSDCQFSRRPALLLASRKGDLSFLGREARAHRAAGFQVDLLTAHQLREQFGVRAPGALLSQDAAQLDPYRFAHDLTSRFVAAGGQVYEQTNVTGWTASARQVELALPHSRRIRTKHLVVAAGYEAQELLRQRLVRHRSTYVVVTPPQPGGNLAPPAVIWETQRPYHYLRSTADGRVMIGGGDEDFVNAEERDKAIGQKSEELLDYYAQLIPGAVGQGEYAWAGTFGETLDSLPYIGTMRGAPRVHYALCYGANGTNFAVLAAQIIRDQLRGKSHPSHRLFSFYRRIKG